MNRGLAVLQLGQKDMAQKDFDAAVRLQPELKDRIAEATRKIHTSAKLVTGRTAAPAPSAR
jgi:Tfp pilus assembly protein PilF